MAISDVWSGNDGDFVNASRLVVFKCVTTDASGITTFYPTFTLSSGGTVGPGGPSDRSLISHLYGVEITASSNDRTAPAFGSLVSYSPDLRAFTVQALQVKLSANTVFPSPSGTTIYAQLLGAP